jgi:hypothetical protein
MWAFLGVFHKQPPERNLKASDVKEGVVDEEQMLMTNQQQPELAEPGKLLASARAEAAAELYPERVANESVS